jgi:hypothetical protein
MKNDVMPSIVRMDADELKALLTEVKETVATDFKSTGSEKRFSVADMWNIRRNAKSASSMLRRK